MNDLSSYLRPLNWKFNLLWVGLFLVGLSGGLYFSAGIQRKLPAAAPPPPPSVNSQSSKPERSAPSAPHPIPADRHSVTALAASSVFGATKTNVRTASKTSGEIAESNQTRRLQSKSSLVVLGSDAPAIRELSEHPSRLPELVYDGSLFTVLPGTAIQVEESESGMIKVLILEGSMAGREGWTPSSQVAPLHRAAK